MEIIEANKFHTDVIIEMLKRYRSHTPIKFMEQCDNIEYIKKLLSYVFAGRGIVLLAMKDDKAIGMIIGFVDQSIWDPEVCVLKELAYWVDEEHRGSTAGYRLIKKYNDIANSWILNGRIKTATISKMVNSPDLDYSKFGYKKCEETWSLGV